MANVTLKVEGMTCDHCVHAVQKSLSGVPGIKEAKVSLSDKEAFIVYEGSLDIQKAVLAVENEGYQASLKQ